jgi:hypothetical protein
MAVKNMIGVAPELRRYLEIKDKALAGDIVMSITPATVTPAPTSAAWTRNVLIKFTTAAGEVHEWLNDTFANTLAIGDTATPNATIASTTLTIVNGVAAVVVTGAAGTWANGETDTLTVSNCTVLGVTVTGGTSVETFTT